MSWRSGCGRGRVRRCTRSRRRAAAQDSSARPGRRFSGDRPVEVHHLSGRPGCGDELCRPGSGWRRRRNRSCRAHRGLEPVGLQRGPRSAAMMSTLGWIRATTERKPPHACAVVWCGAGCGWNTGKLISVSGVTVIATSRWRTGRPVTPAPTMTDSGMRCPARMIPSASTNWAWQWAKTSPSRFPMVTPPRMNVAGPWPLTGFAERRHAGTGVADRGDVVVEGLNVPPRSSPNALVYPLLEYRLVQGGEQRLTGGEFDVIGGGSPDTRPSAGAGGVPGWVESRHLRAAAVCRGLSRPASLGHEPHWQNSFFSRVVVTFPYPEVGRVGRIRSAWAPCSGPCSIGTS